MKTLKTAALLLVALFAVQGAMAQKRTKSVVHTDSTTVITIVKTVPNFSPKHDIRVGIGTLSAVTSILLDGGWGTYDYVPSYDFRNNMASCDIYRTPRYFVGNYSLSYTYHDRHWLQYGGMVAFGASTCWNQDVATGKKTET